MCSMWTVLAMKNEHMEVTRDFVIFDESASFFFHVSESDVATALYTPRPTRIGASAEAWSETQATSRYNFLSPSITRPNLTLVLTRSQQGFQKENH